MYNEDDLGMFCEGDMLDKIYDVSHISSHEELAMLRITIVDCQIKERTQGHYHDLKGLQSSKV
jgi:hypothetical protein